MSTYQYLDSFSVQAQCGDAPRTIDNVLVDISDRISHPNAPSLRAVLLPSSTWYKKHPYRSPSEQKVGSMQLTKDCTQYHTDPDGIRAYKTMHNSWPGLQSFTVVLEVPLR